MTASKLTKSFPWAVLEDQYTVSRNRAHAMLRAKRGDVTAQWSAYGLSDRPNCWGSSYPR